MNNWTDVGTLLAIITPITFVAIYGFSSVKKGKNDVLRLANKDLSDYNTVLLTEKARNEETVKQQAGQLLYLQSVATQTPEVKELIKATAEQQKLINKQHSEVIKQLADLAKEISKMTAEFSRVVEAMRLNTTAQDVNSVSQDANRKSRERKNGR